uniref:Histone acetyltransferase n=1 Tax=Trichuris muris TaxID=70415 RepID=A0A5S6QHX8_TRIMR
MFYECRGSLAFFHSGVRILSLWPPSEQPVPSTNLKMRRNALGQMEQKEATFGRVKQHETLRSARQKKRKDQPMTQDAAPCKERQPGVQIIGRETVNMVEKKRLPQTLDELRQRSEVHLNKSLLRPANHTNYKFVHASSNSERWKCKIDGMSVKKEVCKQFWDLPRRRRSKMGAFSLKEKQCEMRLRNSGCYAEQGHLKKWFPFAASNAVNETDEISDRPTRRSKRLCAMNGGPSCSNDGRSGRVDSSPFLPEIVTTTTVFKSVYQSRFPLSALGFDRLFVCDNCFAHFWEVERLLDHEAGCRYRESALGSVVYNAGDTQIHQIEGRVHAGWKNWYPVAHFSKQSEDNYVDSGAPVNVCCIFVFPQFVRQGYVRLIIDFSSLLWKVIKLSGIPDRSVFYDGIYAYRCYWMNVICVCLERSKGAFSARSQPLLACTAFLFSIVQRFGIEEAMSCW